MPKHLHEIRDPIHVFVRLDSDERRVLDSRAFQRLRHIHQLALTYQIYPAATHKRFEHSLGVMELASRVFDVIVHRANVSDAIRQVIPELEQTDKLAYWKRVLRLAALCHDLGHLPFSHAAEEQLLPKGWDHERISREIIESAEMKAIWESLTPPIRSIDLVKLALGPRKARDVQFTLWEAILSEVIVGDSFGVDRIDYLLRDSHHAGVAYGRFDHYRLVDTLRILPTNESEAQQGGDVKPTLGVEEGGIHSAEALLLARYHMYSQVYFHSIRRIYDVHLKDFLTAWLPGGKFSVAIADHLLISDNEVNAAITAASLDEMKPGHDPARRIARHDHFKLLYQRHPADVRTNPEAGKLIFEATKDKFGEAAVRYDRYTQKRSANIFPVVLKDGRIVTSVDLSETLERMPIVAVEFVFIEPSKLDEAKRWLNECRQALIQPGKESP